MKSGQIVFKGKTARGQQIVIRYPRASDLKELLNYINALSKEKTFISFQNKLIGIASIDLGERVSKHVGNLGISVAKDFRAQGVGSLLMENILKEAKKYLPNLRIITLAVFANNPVAAKMYQKFGFKEYGKLPNAILHRGRLVDRIYMYCQVWLPNLLTTISTRCILSANRGELS